MTPLPGVGGAADEGAAAAAAPGLDQAAVAQFGQGGAEGHGGDVERGGQIQFGGELVAVGDQAERDGLGQAADHGLHPARAVVDRGEDRGGRKLGP